MRIHFPKVSGNLSILVFFTLALGACRSTAGERNTANANIDGLEIAGAVPSPLKLTIDDLRGFRVETLQWKRGTETRVYTGVSLEELLKRAGFEPGQDGKSVPGPQKHRGYRKALVIEAADGYSTVFSCAEVISAVGATKTLLAWSRDGKALDPSEGPLRLVVPTDADPSRCIHQVVRITVVDLNPPPGR